MYLRLDRAMATQDWVDYFKDIKVHHVVDSTSDHCVLLISDNNVAQKHPIHR